MNERAMGVLAVILNRKAVLQTASSVLVLSTLSLQRRSCDEKILAALKIVGRFLIAMRVAGSLVFPGWCQLQKLTHALLREDAPIGVRTRRDATMEEVGDRNGGFPGPGSTPTPPPTPPSLDPREVATLGDRKRGPKKASQRSKRVALYPVSLEKAATLAAGAVRSSIGKGSSVTSGTGGRGVTGEDKTKTEWPSLTKTCLCKRTTVSWCQTP